MTADYITFYECCDHCDEGCGGPAPVPLQDLSAACDGPTVTAVEPWTVRADGRIAQEFGMIVRDDSLLAGIGWDEDAVVEQFKEQLAPYDPEWIRIDVRTDVVVTERFERTTRNGERGAETILEGGTIHREIVVSGAVWLTPASLDSLRSQP